MHPFLSSFAGCTRPLASRVELAALARGLGHNVDRCLMRAQGKCPGKDQCADCHWAESPARGYTHHG